MTSVQRPHSGGPSSSSARGACLGSAGP